MSATSQDMMALKALTTRLAGQACHLPEPARKEAFAEIISELGVAAAGVIAVAMRGDDRQCGIFADAFALQVIEATGDMARSVRDLDAKGRLPQ